MQKLLFLVRSSLKTENSPLELLPFPQQPLGLYVRHYHHHSHVQTAGLNFAARSDFAAEYLSTKLHNLFVHLPCHCKHPRNKSLLGIFSSKRTRAQAKQFKFYGILILNNKYWIRS